METTLRERIDDSEFESVRTLCGGLYDAFAHAIEIPGSMLPGKYAGKVPWTAIDPDRLPSDESVDSVNVCSVDRINAIDGYRADFPSARILPTMSARTIRKNHANSLFAERANEMKADAEFHQERRVLLLAKSEDTEFGIMYSEIDYVLRDEKILAFARMIESNTFLETEIHVSDKW